MREILFRGRRFDNDEWIYGYLGINPSDPGDDENTFMSDLENPWVWHYVYPETVGQYTGMLDANGKKIFEGDFVKVDDDVKSYFSITDGVVMFARGHFYISGKNNQRLLDSLDAVADYRGVVRGLVSGNIHDNPELKELTHAAQN